VPKVRCELDLPDFLFLILTFIVREGNARQGEARVERREIPRELRNVGREIKDRQVLEQQAECNDRYAEGNETRKAVDGDATPQTPGLGGELGDLAHKGL